MSNSLSLSAVIAVIVVVVSGYVVSYSVDMDTVADILFTGMLDAAYAAHGTLSLVLTSSIAAADDPSITLGSADGIITFESGTDTYAVVAVGDDAVQILNITNPSIIAHVGNIIRTDLELSGASYMDIFESGTDTYVAVTAYNDDGIQILNITDPSNITPAGSIEDTDESDLELAGAYGIAIFKSGIYTYAAVAAAYDDGVQILNVTNPYNITATSHISNNATLTIGGATGITTFESDGDTYAAVTAYSDHGVQILNITNPSKITAAGNITDNDADLKLYNAWDIAVFDSGVDRYAAVTSLDENAVQILNITDPYDITAAGSINSTLNLNGARGIAIFKSSGHIHAAVAASSSDSVQILDVTDPYNITAAGNITNTNSSKLNSPRDVATFKSDGYTYIAVTARTDNAVQIIRVGEKEDGNMPPTVNAGTDQTVGEGNTVTLSGTATDSEGDAVSYTWSAQPGTGITFTNVSSASTTFTAPVVTSETTFTLRLTANDGTDDGFDTIDVIVKDTSGAFITTWRTTTANESITIPVGGATGTYDVIWGDGTAFTGVTGDQRHFYAVPGNHTVTISGGFERIYINSVYNNAPKLVSIDQWGNTQWISMHNAFQGATGMAYSATDVPDLSGVQNMRGMFDSALSFNGDLSSWNVSSVTNMSEMFLDATIFNLPINNWDVSSVTTMERMFLRADNFDQHLNNWDVSSVTNMFLMFSNADNFNRPLNSWNVSSVIIMDSMFLNTDNFDQPLNSWNVSSVTIMDRMFFNAADFNQPLNSWNVSSVTDMGQMFSYAADFNQPLNSWNVSSVTDMGQMFDNANSFHQNLGNWYVVANSTSIARADVPGVIAEISAQNSKLGEHTPTYGIGDGINKDFFEIVGGNHLNMTSAGEKSSYTVNVTASGPNSI